MSFFKYSKIREVRKSLEECFFFNISDSGVSTVRHTSRQVRSKSVQ
jgi:hypothetical protein